MVVFMMAGFRATPASDANAEVQRIAKFHTLLRAVVADGDIRAVVFLGILFQMLQHCGKLLLVELPVMLLEEIIDGNIVFKEFENELSKKLLIEITSRK